MLQHLIDFIAENPANWITLIQQEPYNIKVCSSGNFILLKYDQLNSDMSLPICQVCRGIILEKHKNSSKWSVVCYPFDKFFNYGECTAATIDWESAIVREKVDGSLMKLWTDLNGEWHLATNGTIDAFKAPVSGNLEGLTYGDIFERAIGYNFKLFARYLNPYNTYMFELVSPLTQVTVFYEEDAVYYLGHRNKLFGKESYEYDPYWKDFGVREPKVYKLNSINDCIALVNTFTKDEEGVVVSDREFNRIKVKSPEYLLAAHAANNGKLGLRTAVRLIQEDKVDDFLAYAPMHKNKMDIIIAAYREIEDDFYNAFYVLKEDFWMPRKNFVHAIQYHFGDSDIFAYLMWQYSNRDYGIKDYMHRLTERKIMDLIKEKIKKEMEEIDDE